MTDNVYSLFSRLSILFTFILIGLGVLIWLIAHQSQQRYFEETTQQLNRPVAMYIAEKIPLFVNGRFDQKALADLAAHVMIVNPSLELYLLDSSGQVVASAVGDTRITDTTLAVNLKPVHAFLEADAQVPIYGDDPRTPGRQRIFSAFPLSDSGIGGSDCQPCGYVYAVLGGEQFPSGLQALKSSQTLQFATLLLATVLLCTFLTCLCIFFTLTRPLRAMTKSIEQWQLVTSGSQNDETVHEGLAVKHHANELEVLQNTCHDMALRLSKQYIQLDNADRRRRQFFTSLSHDLRTPLTSVCGALETLMTTSIDLSVEDRRNYLSVAYRQARRLHRLIDQVFELARLDSGDISLELEPLSFQELAMDTIQELLPQAALRGVRLHLVSDGTERESLIYGDMRQLNRVLVNLLTNAIRHTHHNGSVSVQTQVSNEQEMIITIADSGCGFATKLENQPLSNLRLINVGGQASVSGTGLGLGIVSRILALHGSEATICSSPGCGVRVKFTLPTIGAA